MRTETQLRDELERLGSDIAKREGELKSLRTDRDKAIVALKDCNLRVRNVDIGELAGVSGVYVSRLIREGVGFSNAGWRKKATT